MRRILPGGLALAGVLAATQGGVMVGFGGGLIFAAGLLRLGVLLLELGGASQSDRDREIEAREHFTRTGRWPDEPPR